VDTECGGSVLSIKIEVTLRPTVSRPVLVSGAPKCFNNERATKSEVEVNLRTTVSRPVSLGDGHPSRASDQFFFLLEIFFKRSRDCYFVAPPLARGRVCNLLVQLLLGLARAVTLWSKSCRTHGHNLLQS
jgi:hypothetical protein